ncbi:MAG: hypothetical protein LRS48_05510 [Desulfurococcales archaeon]|nr:hypothetical protein [Desulfurococcales archaeon]
MGDEEWMRATIHLPSIARTIRLSVGDRRVTVEEISLALGIDTRAAGKLLARLERMGLAVRISRGRYRILPSALSVPYPRNRVDSGENPQY